MMSSGTPYIIICDQVSNVLTVVVFHCQVMIFYSQLQYEKITVVRAYSWAALMSDLGGAMGLILGSTVLTAAEILDFVIVTSYDGCHRHKTKRKAKPFLGNLQDLKDP